MFFQGDSGGPLMHYDASGDVYTLVGVVAAGIGCGGDVFPGMYTDVDRYRGWIEGTVGSSQRFTRQ